MSRGTTANFPKKKESRRGVKEHKKKMSRAYIISDSTFSKEPAGRELVVSGEIGPRVRGSGKGGKASINELEQRENPTRTRKSQEREREEDEMQSGDSDCLAGDMIILSVSVFKEDVALDLNEKERMPEGERGRAVLVHERQSVTRTARGASPFGSSFSSSSS